MTISRVNDCIDFMFVLQNNRMNDQQYESFNGILAGRWYWQLSVFLSEEVSVCAHFHFTGGHLFS